MRSIFHTHATTAEHLRGELIGDLHRRIAAEEAYGKATASTIKERAIVEGRIRLLNDLIMFWEALVIDPPPAIEAGQ